MKNRMIKGGLHGLTAGIIATFFDSVYMLFFLDAYVPAEYPVLVLLTNLFFWTVFGGITGVCLYLLYRGQHSVQEKKQSLQLLFFLLPFALVYGFLGKFSYGHLLHPGFDSNFVFLLVLVFIVFVIARQKKKPESEVGAGLFIPELFTIIALFHFCSNISQFTWAQISFGWFFDVDFLSEYVRYFRLFNRYCAVLYGIGAFVVFCLYFFVTSKIKLSKIKPALMLTVLILTTAVFAGMCFWANRAAFLKQYNQVSALPQYDENKTFPPVILIVLDTLRKRSFDEHPDVFKNLSAFARESLVFESCVANSSWTLPSHASLFTGLAPREHGADLRLEFDRFPFPHPLHDKFTTLAEVFAVSGYQTAAIISNFGALNPGCCGLLQGFHLYDCSKSIGFVFGTLPFKPLMHVGAFLMNLKNEYVLPYRKAEDINTAVALLLQRFSRRPFFLFINYMDPHDPYMPTYRFKKIFFKFFDLYGHALVNRVARFFNLISEEYQCSLTELFYKGEIAYIDHHLGILFERLKAKGIYDKALIVITSDHGELFCEHGYNRHKTPLYEGVVRVPLFVKFPHQKVTGTMHHYITLADLYPTILTVCGLPCPEMVSGKPFGKPAGPVVAEFYNYEFGAHRALYDGNFKYMKFERGKENALYDLMADPREKNNIIDSFPEKATSMEATLADWVIKYPPLYEKEVYTEIDFEPVKFRDDLRSLGYIQ